MYQFFTVGNHSPSIVKSKKKAEKLLKKLTEMQAVRDFAKTVDDGAWLVLMILRKNQLRNLI